MDFKTLKEKLEKMANRKCWQDDPEFMPHEYAGGNIDDAYYGGIEDGQIQYARDLLKEFFNG